MKQKSLLDFNGVGYRAPMTPEESKMLIGLIMMEMQNPEPDDRMREAFATDAAIMILTSRLDFHGVKATPAAILHAVCSSDGRPGTLVTWAYTFAHIVEKNKVDKVTMDELCREFPNGFPTEKAKRECWDAQKQHGDFYKGISDNAYDMAENW